MGTRDLARDLEDSEAAPAPKFGRVVRFRQPENAVKARVSETPLIVEHAVVRLVRNVPEHQLLAGAIGTVVHVYERAGYEVEFENVPQPTVVTLNADDVEEIVQRYPSQN